MKSKLKAYRGIAMFEPYDTYDDLFNIWAHNKKEAQKLIDEYYINCGNYFAVDILFLPIKTLIYRINKKIPDKPTCEHI